MNLVQTLTNNALVRAEARIKAKYGSKAEFARTHDIPKTTVVGWFNRRVIGLTTLSMVSRLVGLHPAVMLLSDKEHALLARCRELLDQYGEHGRAEALNELLEGPVKI